MRNNDTDLVIKSNSLANASYNLTVSEFRMLQMVFSEISKADKGSYPSKHEFQVYAKEYASLFSVTNEAAYMALQEATNRLFNRYFSYWVEDRKENVKLRWVQKIIYSESNGYIAIQLTDDVIAMVGRLDGYFTQYKIKQIANLTSIYALKLYEIISSYRNMKKTPVIELKELRAKLGVGDDEYSQMNNFKARVLDLALKQINEHTNFHVEYEQHKRGRSIYGFSFHFVELLGEKEIIRDPNTIDWVDESPKEEKKKREKMTLNQIVAKHPNETMGLTEPQIFDKYGSMYYIVK